MWQTDDAWPNVRANAHGNWRFVNPTLEHRQRAVRDAEPLGVVGMNHKIAARLAGNHRGQIVQPGVVRAEMTPAN
jgi:hypothetical protein